MGRRRVGAELLDKPLALRVPSAVAEEWRAAAGGAGLSLADWLRQAVEPGKVRVSGRPSPRSRPKLTKAQGGDPATVAGLARIGNNLNQLGRWANTYKNKADAAQLLIALAAIERQLSALLPPGVAPDEP